MRRRIFLTARRLSALALALTALQAAAAEPVVRHYDWLTAGKPSGSMKLEIHADGDLDGREIKGDMVLEGTTYHLVLIYGAN